ncbi:MAG TPA: hypothetical protein VLC46_05165 [Thermoanaerobaculia bacterium]|jgi:hypothetical protein|nr:hypothetical protein [Thermoanaerobaculia bacterium]
MNVLGRVSDRPTFANLINTYREVEKVARRIKRNYSRDLFDTKPFNELVFVASETAQRFTPTIAG